MIDLRPQDHRVLCALARAASHGLQLAHLSAAERLSAIMLSLLGLAEIPPESPQRAVITTLGAAHRYRVAS